MTALAEHVEERANQVEREPITVVCSAKGWLRALKGHQEQSKDDKYREGDRARFWFHAQTTDQIMLLATDGRFFTLDGSKLPGGRGNGEAIRSFIDLPPDADIVTMFVHVPGRKLLVAATIGHGFITNEDDAVAMTKNGKRVMNVKPGVEAASCRPADGDHVAVVGENRKLLIFPAGRGAGTGARAGRLSAALQGWRPDRRRRLHLEGGPEGRKWPAVRAVRAQGLEGRTRPGRPDRAARLGQIRQIRRELANNLGLTLDCPETGQFIMRSL